MQLMVAGDKWELYIPSDLAYGDRGSPPKIQGGDVLIFTMEILGIMGDTVNALTCRVDATEGCDERESTYVEKVKAWKATKVASEVNRVHTILQKPMSDELRDWARRRVHILQQLVVVEGEKEL
jgi:hypothetical protein